MEVKGTDNLLEGEVGATWKRGGRSATWKRGRRHAWKGEGWGQATWNGQVGRYGKGAGDMEVKGEYNMERDVGRHGNRAGEGDMEVKGARSMKRGG